VVCGITIVKQKRQACAAFLGVLAVSINLLRVCCILTTIFGIFALPDRILESEEAYGRHTNECPFANQSARENTAPVASDSPHEKGRSAGRCGL
jgi:hypothetical protein